MVRYLLDTNICIYLTHKHPPSVREHLRRIRSSEIAISSITLAELEHGARKKNKEQEIENLLRVLQVLPFDTAAAKAFAQIAMLSNRQQNAMDKLIAAHALSLGAVLVTNNESDFAAFPIEVENWVKA